MMAAEDLARAAFQALLRGDTAERDRLCKLAANVVRMQERVARGEPVVQGEPILLEEQ